MQFLYTSITFARKRNTGTVPFRITAYGIVFLFLSVSCDSIAVDEPNFQLTGTSVFDNDATAEATVLGIYSNMMSGNAMASGGGQSITLLAGLSADELVNYSFNTTQGEFYNNALLPSNSWIELYVWNAAYSYIYGANAVVEGLKESPGVTGAVAERLKGEARFIRAFCYFYLLNLFGDVPLVMSTDYKASRGMSRTLAEEVYKQAITDLLAAQELLPGDYSVYGGERSRPCLWTAKALLARVYLYREAWPEAEAEATAVIENTTQYQLLPDLNTVFLKNSEESIWQLMPVAPGINTREGSHFILTGRPASVALDSGFPAIFEPGDRRKTDWIEEIAVAGETFYYPFKYKIDAGNVLTEYSTVLRLAEQYLVRAEARARQGNITGAQHDLNVVRNRAGLDNTTAVTQAALLDAIMHERRTELFTEWGHRWFDLKRTGRASSVLGTLKQGWQDSDKFYPLPQKELQNNPNMVQNEGY